jgi:hypothetical protein
MILYIFRTVRLSIIRSLFTVHSVMVYAIQVFRQLSSRELQFHPGPARKSYEKYIDENSNEQYNLDKPFHCFTVHISLTVC